MLRGRFLAVLAVLCTVFVVVPSVAQAAFGSRVLKMGTRGSDVRTLQKHLTKLGFRTTADGVFGRGTRRTVRSWETASELEVNGRVGKRDAKLIRKAVRALAREQRAEQAPASSDEAETAPDDPGSPGGAAYVKVQKATLNPDGTATPPPNAPEAVKRVIEAGNRIARKPYKYGGGHGKWEDSGYDCSGSVSYALRGGGFVESPMPSGGYTSWGERGPGRWITVYAHGGHMYMVVAGLRFDTSAAKAQANGSRWTDEMRSSSGFTVRHPQGY